MIEAIHRHLLSELDRAGRSDTIFVLAGVLFNLLVLFINWTQAGNLTSDYGEPGPGTLIIFIVFMIGTIIVSAACILTLHNSRKICHQCHQALSRIYEDSNVSQYMPDSMSGLGEKRFVLSYIVVAGTGLLAVLVPLVVVFGS